MVVLELRITTMPSSLARLDGLIDSFAEDKMNRWKGNESNRMNESSMDDIQAKFGRAR